MNKEKELIVAWQSPLTREWIPIGRLSKKDDLFCFVYTQGVKVAKKKGFLPFRHMTEFTKEYTSEQIFPTFANKILPKSRPEYRNYKQWLGLNSDNVLDELAMNNGIKATDNIELYAIPQKKEFYEVEFFAHGFRHLSVYVEERLKELKEKDTLYLAQDLQNKSDDYALLIRAESPAELIGYVPRIYTKDITTLLKSDQKAELKVKKINIEAPLQFRLLCEFRAKWQKDFKAFQDKKFHKVEY
nr:HIRAN domain-containing protein [uncultured Helicobacter sp.]